MEKAKREIKMANVKNIENDDVHSSHYNVVKRLPATDYNANHLFSVGGMVILAQYTASKIQ